MECEGDWPRESVQLGYTETIAHVSRVVEREREHVITALLLFSYLIFRSWLCVASQLQKFVVFTEAIGSVADSAVGNCGDLGKKRYVAERLVRKADSLRGTSRV
jgi:hypothetical protein